ncbi:hypothetical protein Tco_0152369 [Tanacetum coccineum]
MGPDYQFGYPQGKSKIFNGGYGEYYNSQWTLPPAWTESGVMLVLPADPGLWSEVISRWETMTINRLNNQTWSDNKAKLAFVENLLGESEKLMWQQWRTAYPGAYSALEAIADEPQNITSHVRQLILLEDPYHGSTDEQDRAYRDLDRITCEETKNLWSFLEDFRQLATKSRRLYFPSTTEKLFAKLPPSLSKKIEESFRAKHPGLSSGFLSAIKIRQGNIARSVVYKSWTLITIGIFVSAYLDDSKFNRYQKEKLRILKGMALKKPQIERIEKEKLEEQKDEEIRELKAQLQKKKEEEEVQFSKEEFPPLGNIHVAKPCVETEIHYFGNATASPKVRKVTNQLYNVKVEFDIPNCTAFGTTAIIDTGASACCINKKVITKEALEPLTQTVIPLIYSFDMRDSNEIAELEVSEEEFLEINESMYFNQEGSRAFQEQFKLVIDRLKQQGYTGEEPLKHWKKNGELCKLDIINPDITIEDRPLKHVTPAMEDLFKKHVDSLLKIGAICLSKSRHRTMAMIVNSGTTIDPVTGREVKGKERMVFNYKSLNDNTYKDQYSLPVINTIIKRIGGAKIFSKFDLKSGFHQVAMDEESIPWTTFLVPGGLYECLNEKDHAKHLERMLKICEDNGLILSPTKMKISVSIVDFLRAVIGEGTIKLQPHIIKKIVNFNEEELKKKKGLRMHRRNERISSSSSLLSGGSSTVPQCLSEEYEDYLRRSHEDFQPLPRIFTKTIFTPEEPGALYKRYQLKANQTPIRMDKSDAWRSVAQDLKLLAAKEAVKSMRNLQAIIQCKAQICFGQSTKDNHWSDQREDARIQNKEARRILIELEALAQRLGRNNI